MSETVPSPEPTEDRRAVKVGVLLAPVGDGIGEWLADASTFDAAGADALWVDPGLGPDPGQQQEWDVLALAAALSVATFRSLLVVAAPDPGDRPAALDRTLATIERLSHGRLALIAEPGGGAEFAASAPGGGSFRRLSGKPDAFERTGAADAVERWVSMPLPPSRSAWHAARADAAERGAGGLLVPADPRLLDILRNPDDPGGRRDLLLAQG